MGGDNERGMERSAPVNSPFIIREAGVKDAAKVLSFLEPYIIGKKLLPRTVEEIEELTKEAFVAEQEGRIVGFAAIEIYSKKMAELQCLAVAPHCQGRGIGKQLVELCVKRTRRLGVMELMVITASDELFQHCGFDYSLPDQKRALFAQMTNFRNP